jgi:hypothetical protein
VKKQYKGILARPIEYVGEPSLPGATTILAGGNPLADAHYEAEIAVRLNALFRHFGLDPEEQRFDQLAGKLCLAHVPGFKIMKRSRGSGSNPKAFEEHRRAFIEVKRLQREHGMKVSQACTYLARHATKAFSEMTAKDISNDYYAFVRFYRGGTTGKLAAVLEEALADMLLATPPPR